jgi:hypothetical protein
MKILKKEIGFQTFPFKFELLFLTEFANDENDW